MTVYLSEDEGETWKYKACIDTREWISYPDVDFAGDTVYLTYDRDRMGEKEILFVAFREEDVISGAVPPPRVISKP